MSKALAAQRAQDFASGWLLIRSPLMPTADFGLVADSTGDVVQELRRSGDTFERRVALEPAERTRSDWVYAGPPQATLSPEDALLEVDLLRLCARRDLAGLRRTVSTIVEHIRDLDQTDLSLWAAGTFDNVVLTPEGRFQLLDASWRMSTPIRAEDLAVELLDDFAGRLTALGWRHPWPVATGRDELAVLLASAAGISVSVEGVREHRGRREAADRQRGRVDRRAVVVSPDAHALLLEENKGLHSQVAWFKKALRQRDAVVRDLRTKSGQQKPKDVRQVRELQLELTSIKQSRAFRTGQAIARPAGVIRRLIGGFR